MVGLGTVTATMRTSCNRDSASRDRYLARCKAKMTEPDPDWLKLLDEEALSRQQREQHPDWCKNNLEYDLRSTDWICAKAQASQSYAQNIYAALCNQSWQRNDVWPRLQGKTWSCTWRYAGGIVANMVETGDYLDWYCSGIRDVEAAANHCESKTFVGEGIVTDEIRNDFFKLGWIPVDQDSTNEP